MDIQVLATIPHNSFVSGWHCPCPQHAVHLLNLCVHLVKTVNRYVIWWFNDSVWFYDSSQRISTLSTIPTVPALARQEDFACSDLGVGCASNFRLAWRGWHGRWLEETSTNIIRLLLFYVYVVCYVVNTFFEKEMPGGIWELQNIYSIIQYQYTPISLNTSWYNIIQYLMCNTKAS